MEHSIYVQQGAESDLSTMKFSISFFFFSRFIKILTCIMCKFKVYNVMI